MRVLIACEFSGIIRDAFLERGHNAISCDLLPTERQGPHYQGNVFDILYDGWDLLIAHPPCTYLSYAGKEYWNLPGRARKRLEALRFFLDLWEAPIERICIENPLGIADGVIAKYNQIIHPYYFGDKDMKRTCLWLKNLPPLVHVNEDNLFSKRTHANKPEPIYIDRSGKRRYFTDAIPGTNNGGHNRSRSFPGIAKAMAEQWGSLGNLK
ncbi:MAG: hypothetical protein GX459_11955 [Bacteroidales bacterium]|nr:hypothetical protein [Bacteroidales bacterium]